MDLPQSALIMPLSMAGRGASAVFNSAMAPEAAARGLLATENAFVNAGYRKPEAAPCRTSAKEENSNRWVYNLELGYAQEAIHRELRD